jgi:hypothetical protein
LSAEKIVEEYPHRTRSEIYAVLAWYYAHQEEFDHELAAEAADDERLARFGRAPREIKFTPESHDRADQVQ